MIVNQDEPTLSPEEKTMTDKLVAIDFSKIPSTEELDKMKVKPKNRWFNSLMSIIIITIGISLGVIIGLIINHFA
ncbi:MAG: hypothetical protein LBM72_01170 [Mycoplasmataceae bacterium]|nr:hypothetical protein [Mycoplasmataceae bacterium]